MLRIKDAIKCNALRGGRIIGGAIMMLAVIGLVALSHEAYAEIGSSDVDFSLSVDATPSLEIVLAGDGLTTSPTSLGLNIKPNIDGTPVFGYSDLDVTVATSNATGYYLNFSTTNDDGSLRTTSSSTLSTLADTGTFTCTTATASTCSFTTNRWGYKLAQDDATSYIAAPGSDGTKIDEIYTKTNGVTSNLRVGAKVDSSLTAGNYSTTMSFAATAHPTTYGIYYNAGTAGNSASGLPATQSGALNNASTTTIMLSSSTPTWTGHTFNKWCLGTVTSTDYQNDTCTGTEYSPGDSITFSMDDVVSVTLKAMWNINTYTATIKTATGVSKVTLNGTECTSTSGCNVSNLIYGKDYSLVATLDTGYSLSTWSATAGTIANNTTSTTYTVGAGNATITPGATLDSYEVTVTFVDGANQVLFGNSTYGNVTATASSPTVSLYYNQPYTATMSFSSNYEFSSWTAGTNTSVSSTGTNPTTVTLTGADDGTLTATGKASGFTVTYNANGGTTTPESQSSFSSITLSSAISYHTASTTNTSTTYATFAGWNTAPDGSGTTYSAGSSYTPTANTTLYAKWNFYSGTLQNTSSTCGNNMIDARTGVSYKTYTISNQCYMEQNLYLPTGFTLYAGDSNIYGATATKNQQVSWATPTTLLTADSTNPYNQARMMEGTYKNNTYNVTGGWYNYCAASAGTVCDDSTKENANSDICPKGWRLPTNSEMGNVASANRSYWKFYAGYYMNGSLQSASTYSYWWSATAENAQGQYLLYYSNSSLNTSGGKNKHLGGFVRCVREDRTIADVTYMQDVTSTIFKNTTVGTTATLKDNRDNQNYVVKKLDDGRIWMMTNLNLGATTLTTDLTSANTNLSTTVTASTFNGWKESRGSGTRTSAEFIPVSGTDSTSGTAYGTLYNYCAASAGTICTDSSTINASSDLCPAGWRLPTGGSGGEFATLYANASYNTYAKMRASVANGGAAFALAGYFFSGTPNNQGSTGYYWSSTCDDNIRMHNLRFDTSGVYPFNYDTRGNASSIRCILKAKA